MSARKLGSVARLGSLAAIFSFVATTVCLADTIPAIRTAPPTPAQVEYEKGRDALTASQLPAAEASFQHSLQLDPKLVNALLGLAEVHLRKGDAAGAGSYLEKAVGLAPADAKIQTDLGHYLFFRKHYDEAEKAFNAAIKIDPKSARPYFEKGDLYLAGMNRPKEAIEAYRAGLAIDSTNAEAHYGLGNALTRAGNPAEAESQFKEAARLAPKNPTMLQSLAILYAGERRYDQALTTYSETLKVQPAFFPANFGRGDVFLATGAFDKALIEYQAALKIDPKSAVAYYKIGIVYERESQGDKANQAFLTAIKLDDKSAAAYNELAWLAADRKENLDQGLVWAQKAVSLAPRDPNVLDTLAWIYRARRQNDDAIASLQKALALAPKDSEALYHMGVIYSEMGQPSKARAAFTMALSSQPNFLDSKDAKARLAGLPQH